MIVKGITEEDFSNYKVPSMFISFPNCTFKCGKQVCQNGTLAISKDIDVDIDGIADKYINNKFTHAIVCGGLEPFDSWKDLLQLITRFRLKSTDDIVIYTGYYKEEIEDTITLLSRYKNIIIKFGRFVPNQDKHYDEILGVYLASDNQHAERIS